MTKVLFYKHALQDPECVKLGERRAWKGVGMKRRCVSKDDQAMYVPVLKTLQSILKNEAICVEVTITL